MRRKKRAVRERSAASLPGIEIPGYRRPSHPGLQNPVSFRSPGQGRPWVAAHRLQPENWTYKRNAWELVSPGIQGPSDFYDGDWLSDIKAAGPEHYYAPPDF